MYLSFLNCYNNTLIDGGSYKLKNAAHYRGADKSLARPTSRCILFDASLVIYINSNNIPQL